MESTRDLEIAPLLFEQKIDQGMTKRKNTQKQQSTKRFATYNKLVQTKNELSNKKRDIEEEVTESPSNSLFPPKEQNVKIAGNKRSNSMIDFKSDEAIKRNAEYFAVIARKNNLRINFEDELGSLGQNLSEQRSMIAAYGNSKFKLATSTGKDLNRSNMENFLNKNLQRGEVPLFILQNSPSHKARSKQTILTKSNSNHSIMDTPVGEDESKLSVKIFSPKITKNLGDYKSEGNKLRLGSLRKGRPHRLRNKIMRDSKSMNTSPQSKHTELKLPLLKATGEKGEETFRIRNSKRLAQKSRNKSNSNRNSIPELNLQRGDKFLDPVATDWTSKKKNISIYVNDQESINGRQNLNKNEHLDILGIENINRQNR